MNRIYRMLTVTGVGLFAGAAIGAGPALAATGGEHGVSTTTAAPRGTDRDRVIGYFRSFGSCVLVGRIGEKADRWDDFDCDRVGLRAWALEVSWDPGAPDDGDDSRDGSGQQDGDQPGGDEQDRGQPGGDEQDRGQPGGDEQDRGQPGGDQQVGDQQDGDQQDDDEQGGDERTGNQRDRDPVARDIRG